MPFNSKTSMAIFLAFFSHQTEAQMTTMTNVDKSWRWYRTSFCSPALNAKLCTRSGLANVRIQKNRIHASLKDAQISESPIHFAGNFEKQNVIRGVLNGLSPHSPIDEAYHGSYSAQKMGKDCKVEQVVLFPTISDGSVLSISRVQGACQ